jgi:uncharacterized protein (DUF1015 family)
MARIFPFHRYRYSPAAGPLEDLVTQPYDKISASMQSRYLDLNPHNLVRVIFGERRHTDTPEANVYTRAGAHFRGWIEQGVLERDNEAAFYPYYQEFTVPDTGERLVRKGFVGLGAVEDYEKRIVHRHEQTLSGPKKDRMEVLKSTGAHFGQLFMLYPDREGAIDRILDQAMQAGVIAEVTDEYGAIHRLGKIADPGMVRRVQELMSDKKLLIADGHHRYETALAYAKDHPADPAAQAVMMTFVNMYSPGLRILGTHRLVDGLKDFSSAALKKALEGKFKLRQLASLDELRKAWAEPHSGTIRIGIAAADAPGILLLEKQRGPLELDVTLLHEAILEGALGISAEAVREETYLRYIRGVEVAEREVREGRGQLAFLLEPPSVDQVAEISFGGGVMPQKSTDFYPKLLTGLAIYRLEDGFPAE